MSLTPTQDLVFFPSLLTLKSGESRPIGVVSSSALQDNERSFRIIAEARPRFSPCPPRARIVRTMGRVTERKRKAEAQSQLPRDVEQP
ncbi:hypothetical protein ACLEPN_02845 [Myxococcus sp. 1LA]